MVSSNYSFGSVNSVLLLHFTEIFIHCIALSIFSRSPSTYHAIKSLGILHLPCDRTLKGYMNKYSSSPGINEQAMHECAQKYEDFRKEKVKTKCVRPVGQGVLIWDEVKVRCHTQVALFFWLSRFSLGLFGIVAIQLLLVIL